MEAVSVNETHTVLHTVVPKFLVIHSIHANDTGFAGILPENSLCYWHTGIFQKYPRFFAKKLNFLFSQFGAFWHVCTKHAWACRKCFALGSSMTLGSASSCTCFTPMSSTSFC